jgi:uncharacterized protein YdbL (DUF1318 family)
MAFRKHPGLLPFLVALAAGACVTVNLYFPTAEVQKAADQIVEEVHEGRQEPPAAGRSSFLRGLGCARMDRPRRGARTGSQGRHQSVTPAIRALKQQMKARFPQLVPFFRAGALGETNMGLLEARDTQSLSLGDRARLTRILEAENADRMGLYEEIARANNFAKEQVETIQKLFANSWRSQAEPGTWIQDDRGTWARK